MIEGFDPTACTVKESAELTLEVQKLWFRKAHPNGRLVMSGTYRGFHFIKYAVALIMERPQLILNRTKELYPAIGAHFGVQWTAVERDIRTAIRAAWRDNPELLQAFFGYTLTDKPTVGRFLDRASAYVRDKISVF